MTEELALALASLYAALYVALLVFSATQAVCSRILGYRLDEFSLGYVRPVGIKLLNVRWRLGLLPFGGYARFAPHCRGTGETSFESAPFPQRSLVALSGPAALLLLAIVIVGLDALRIGAATFTELYQVVISAEPFPVKTWFDGIDFGQLLAIVCAKGAALNLLPAPYQAGGVVLRDLGQVILGNRYGADPQWLLFTWVVLHLAVFAVFLYRFGAGVIAG